MKILEKKLKACSLEMLFSFSGQGKTFLNYVINVSIFREWITNIQTISSPTGMLISILIRCLLQVKALYFGRVEKFSNTFCTSFRSSLVTIT